MGGRPPKPPEEKLAPMSFSLEVGVQDLVCQRYRRRGFDSVSAYLRDLVKRALASEGVSILKNPRNLGGGER